MISFLRNINEWAEDYYHEKGVTTECQNLFSMISALATIFVPMFSIIEISTGGFVMASIVALMGSLLAATVFIIIPLTILFVNHCGHTIMGDDFEKIPTIYKLGSRAFERLSFATFVCTTTIMVLALTTFHWVLMVTVGAVILFQIGLVALSKVYNLNKKLKAHVEDKDAHS